MAPPRKAAAESSNVQRAASKMKSSSLGPSGRMVSSYRLGVRRKARSMLAKTVQKKTDIARYMQVTTK